MKPVAPPIIAPLSAFETRVLGAYVEQDKETIAAVAGQEAVAWAEATQTLKWRGFLQAVVDRGVLVTPEGLGCFLGEVGVQVDDAYAASMFMRRASRSATAAESDASTRPSRGRRRSAGSSARTGQAGC
jgi:hypothetical protein